MGSFEAEDSDSDTLSRCPDGHPVGENDLFCPVCLVLLRRSPTTYWTTNDGRDLHPSAAAADSPEEGEMVPKTIGYCQRKRH